MSSARRYDHEIRLDHFLLSPRVASGEEGFTAREFKARVSIPADGILYVRSINIHILCHISKTQRE